MKGLLLHVAADTTYPGVVGPVFQDMSFEYLPVNNIFGIEKRTYRDFAARNLQYGRTLADFVPSNIAILPVHFDPEFDHYTYGQHAGDYARVQTLIKLKQGDILFFFASLAPYDPSVYECRDDSLRKHQLGKKNKYVIGFFTVQGVAQVYVLKSDPRLALTLISLLEEGEPPLDLRHLTSELEILKEYGYIVEKDDVYELTEDGIRTVEGVADGLSQRESNSSKLELLEKGQFTIKLLSGYCPEDAIKANHHYKRLRTLEWDRFILINGDPKRSALLTRAVSLTNRFERYEFKLNKLGRSILRKASDPMRGARRIAGDAVNLLVREIAQANQELEDKVQYLKIKEK